MSPDDRLNELLQRWNDSGRRLSPQELCGDCPEMQEPLREAVEQILRAEAALSGGVPTAGNAVPDRVGSYQILGVLGQGGWGMVYRARQPNVDRVVALKVIRPNLVSDDVLKRFHHETRMLGRLKHPGIGQIYDAGATETGAGVQPFFAMELIEGLPLDTYAIVHRLTVRQRLELLIKLCDAVHYAHQRGIIHRDLKPGNILVTPDGQPKVLDFGIARAIDSDVQTTTMQTNVGQLVGTLPYMSPEQASGDPLEIDTRSDVYALGVIAFELLGGRLPYTLKGVSIPEAVRIIRDEEPGRLSTIDKTYRGDIETIIGKALEKDKTRRYQAASALAADVKRYLDYEPITARPPSAWYNLRKFARRNKGVVGAVAALIVVLAGAVIVSTSLYIRARTQSEIATAVSQFLTARVLAGVSPDRLHDRSAREAVVKAMLIPAADAVAVDFKDKPLTEAAVRDTLAVSFNAIGNTDLGLPHAEVALQIRRRLLGDDHPETLQSISTLGHVLQALGQLDRAEPLIRESLIRSRHTLGDDHRDTLVAQNNLGMLLEMLGDYEGAEKQLREVLDRRRHAPGNNHPDTLTSINNLALVLVSQGMAADAEPLFREALAGRRRELGEEDPGTLQSINNLAFVIESQGRLHEAEPIHREALEKRQRVLGVDHHDTLESLNNYAALRGELHRPDAEALSRDVVERRRRVLTNDHPNILQSINNLAVLLQKLGNLGEAESLFREVVELCRRHLGDDHPNTLFSLANLGALLLARDQLNEAERVYRDALERGRRVLNKLHPTWLRLNNGYGSLLVAQKKYSEAEQFVREALDGRRSVLGERHPDTLSSMCQLAVVIEAQGKPGEAEPLYRQSADGAKAALGVNHEITRRSAEEHAACLDSLSRRDEARQRRREFGLSEPATSPTSQSTTAP